MPTVRAVIHSDGYFFGRFNPIGANGGPRFRWPVRHPLSPVSFRGCDPHEYMERAAYVEFDVVPVYCSEPDPALGVTERVSYENLERKQTVVYYRGYAFRTSRVADAKHLAGFEVLDTLDLHIRQLLETRRPMTDTPAEETCTITPLLRFAGPRAIDLSD